MFVINAKRVNKMENTIQLSNQAASGYTRHIKCNETQEHTIYNVVLLR